MSKRKMGICCTCQQIHPVKPVNTPTDEFWDIDYDAPDMRYVMSCHYPFGNKMCDGTNTVPQALVLDDD